MATVNLQAAARPGAGKELARKLRQANRFPAIVYGRGAEPTPISLESTEFRKAISTGAGTRAVIRLNIDGKDERVTIVKDIQRHPLTRDVIHADLLAIDLDQPVEVSVPVLGVGTPIGVKQEDGVLGWARRELNIRVLPLEIPESIELEISELHVGQALHVEDVVVKGYELLDEPQLTICSVASTKIIEEELEAEAAEGEEAEGAEGAEGEAEGAEPATATDESEKTE